MSSIKKNLAYQTAYQILIVIMPFITSPYLSRILGAKGLGEYSYAYTIAYYFSLFILLGINNHGTREIAKVKDDIDKRSEVFASLYAIQVLMGILVISAYSITQIIIPKDNHLAKIQLLYVASAFLDINWFFFGLEKFKVTVTRNFIIKFLTVASIFLFVKTSDDVALYSIIMASGFLISQIALWPFAIKELKRIHVNWHMVKMNIKPMLVLFIPVVAASVFMYMDKIMLGVMCDKTELGYYDNAEKIMAIPTALITSVGTVMLPRVTNMMKDRNNDQAINKLFSISLIGSMVAASALSFGLAAVGPTFAPWFWGDEFVRSGKLIRVISMSTLFLSWASVIRTQFLIPKGMDTVFVRATVYGAILNFIINYTLIRPLGAMGTVIGTVVAQFILAFYQTIKCKGLIPIRKYIIECVPFIIIGAIMYMCVYYISKLPIKGLIQVVIEILFGGVVFVTLTVIYFRWIKKISFNEMIRIVRGIR